MYEKKGLIAGESLEKIHQKKEPIKSTMIKDPLVMVTARIKKSLREEIRNKGFSIADMVKRGMQTLESFPILLDRIRESEENIGNLQYKLKSQAIKNIELSGEVEKLKQKKLLPLTDEELSQAIADFEDKKSKRMYQKN